jgi:hypothetical protein
MVSWLSNAYYLLILLNLISVVCCCINFRCFFVHLGIATQMHPFALQTYFRYTAASESATLGENLFLKSSSRSRSLLFFRFVFLRSMPFFEFFIFPLLLIPIYLFVCWFVCVA